MWDEHMKGNDAENSRKFQSADSFSWLLSKPNEMDMNSAHKQE